MDDHLNQLDSYIKQQLDNNISADQIRQILLAHNWDPVLVDHAMQSAQASAHAEEPVPQPEAVDSAALAPRKYKLFRAIGDTFTAIKNNALTVILTVVVGYAIALITLLIITILTGAIAGATENVVVSVICYIILYGLWSVGIGALILASTSLALFDGSENFKSSFKIILSRSFSTLGRVVLANLLFSIVTLWPLVVIIILPLILIASGGQAPGASFLLMTLVTLSAIVWIYIALVRYALVPYVALFEPKVSIFNTLGRSAHLMVKGGQWFVVKGILLLLLILIIFSILTGQNPSTLNDSDNIITIIAGIILTVIINGVLVMLYRNRRAVKG